MRATQSDQPITAVATRPKDHVEIRQPGPGFFDVRGGNLGAIGADDDHPRCATTEMIGECRRQFFPQISISLWMFAPTLVHPRLDLAAGVIGTMAKFDAWNPAELFRQGTEHEAINPLGRLVSHRFGEPGFYLAEAGRF